MLIILFIFVFLIQDSFNMLVFPFKTAIYNINPEINQNSTEYNATNYIKDNYYQPAYATIKIGNPPQDIKVLLSYNDCGFKVGKDAKCIYNNDYLSHYNRNSSKDFKFTNYLNKTSYYFPNGKSVEDSIYAYTDLSLKNLQKIENIGFFLETDTNDALCGIIGFKTLNYKLYCSEINNIFDSFKLRDKINSDNWLIKYNSENEGILLFDPELDKIIEDYDPNKLFITNSEKSNTKFGWTILIDKVFSQDNNETLNKKELLAEIDNDFGLIEGNGEYYYYITTTYFENYIKKRICFLNDHYAEPYYYFAIECDKELFGIEDMKNFPILSLISVAFQKEFTFDYKDLFTETKYKYFFNIIFNVYITERWILGKPFLRKYPMMYNYNLQTIGYYNEEFKIVPDTTDEEIADGSSSLYSEKFLFSIIFIIFILIIISGITCYYIGKRFNKIKKKKANELADDDFDYTPSKEIESKLYNEKSPSINDKI